METGGVRFLPSFGSFLHPVVRAETGRSAVSIGVVSKRSVPPHLGGDRTIGRTVRPRSSVQTLPTWLDLGEGCYLKRSGYLGHLETGFSLPEHADSQTAPSEVAERDRLTCSLD